MVIVSPPFTGAFVASHPVEAWPSKPVPQRPVVLSAQANGLRPAQQPPVGGPHDMSRAALQSHVSTNALLTLTGLPCLSNEMLPSAWSSGLGERSATKKSLY